MAPSRYVIGYLLSKKSVSHLMIHSKLKKILLERGIQLQEINEEIPLAEQGNFDAIIHKCSDYIRTAHQGNVRHEKLIEEFIQYPKMNPGVVLIDYPLSVILLANREQMLQVCNECQFVYNGIRVYVPPWISVTSKDGLENRLIDNNIKFPVLFKAHSAAEGEGAHDMQLILNKDQLGSLNLMPSVAQQFENHSGVLYKIFAVGSEFCITTRPSIRDIRTVDGDFSFSEGMKESIFFSSHEVSKSNSLSFLNNYQEGYVERSSYHDKNCILDFKVVSKLVYLIEEKLSCNLLGIDVIINSSGDYGVIDVNYLPSFEGMSNSIELICDHLSDLLNMKKGVEKPLSLKQENNNHYGEHNICKNGTYEHT